MQGMNVFDTLVCDTEWGVVVEQNQNLYWWWNDDWYWSHHFTVNYLGEFTNWEYVYQHEVLDLDK